MKKKIAEKLIDQYLKEYRNICIEDKTNADDRILPLAKNKAIQVADFLMTNRPVPFDLATEFGFSLNVATWIYDLVPQAFGVGGKGYSWLVKKLSTSKLGYIRYGDK